MHKFLKRSFSLFLCITFLIISFIPVPVNALTYESKDSFKDIRFIPGGSSVKAYPEKYYNYDYWVITVQPYSYSDQTKFYAYLYLIADNSYESFGSVEGTLKFDIGQYPYDNKLYAVSTSPALDYEQSVYCRSTMTFSDANCTWIVFDSSNPLPAENPIKGFVFDNYQSDMFPSYKGASSNFTSQMIIASNVDIYSYDGDLLQYGNYHTLIQYLGDCVDKSRIKDYSGHETAPGVVVEPTEPTSPSGTGDNQTSKDQLETSKGIWGTVKDIFNSIANLPGKIAEAIGGFFTDLKDGLIEGIKFLFIPSNNIFDDFVDFIKNKFGFVFQIIEIGDFLLDYDFSDTPPDLSFDFSNYNGSSRFIQFLNGFKFELLDWSVIDPYRGFIRGLISAITWYFFLKSLPKTIVNLINGQIGDENI